MKITFFIPVVLLGVLLLFCFGIAEGAQKNDLLMGVKDDEISLRTGLADNKIGTKFELISQNSLVGGLLFKDSIKTEEGLNFSPFFMASYSNEMHIDPYWGMKGNFFSYRLGSWMFRSDFSVLTNFSNYRFDGRGQFSVGNFRAVGLFRVNVGRTLNTLWPGDRFTDYRRATIFSSFWPFLKPKENYGYLELVRNFDFGGNRLDLSGGVGYFPSVEPYPEIHYTVRTGFEGSFLSLASAGINLRSWSVYIDGSKLKLGMAGVPGKKISLLIGYDFPPLIELEVTDQHQKGVALSLVLKSSW